MREVRISWDTDNGETNTWIKSCTDEECIDLMRQIESAGWELDE